MKNSLIILAAAATATAIAAYLLKRKRSTINIAIPAKSNSSHHITDVFANAKKHVANIKVEEY